MEGAVAGAVVDEDELESLAADLHDGLQAVVEVGYVLLLIVQGNDDGILGHGCLYYTRRIAILKHNRRGSLLGACSCPRERREKAGPRIFTDSHGSRKRNNQAIAADVVASRRPEPPLRVR